MSYIECKKLAQYMKCTVNTLDVYLARSQFSHIYKVPKDEHSRTKIYLGLQKEDIKILSKFIHRPRKRKASK